MADGTISIDERRRHRRQPVCTGVRCRRLGRGGFDESVESLDLSLGGMLLLADRRLGVGDVLHLELGRDGTNVRLQGMVVGVRDAPFTGLHARYVHVAFTSLSSHRLDALAELLAAWDDGDPS